MHDLNLIKGKHQTNLDEGLSTKRLAWNLLAVSIEAGGGGRWVGEGGREELPALGRGGRGVGRAAVAAAAQGGWESRP